MKKLGFFMLLFLTLITVFAIQTFAEGDGEVKTGTPYKRHLVSMDIWTGYTYLMMGEVNKMGNDRYDFYRRYNYREVKINEIHSGINSGVDLNFELVRGFKFGPRLGIIYAFPGEVSARDPNYNYNIKWNSSGMLIPVTAGVSYSLPPTSRVKFSVGANMGFAFGMQDFGSSYQTYYGTYTDNFSCVASGFYGSTFAALKLLFTDVFGMDFRFGYHVASLTDWVVTSTSGNSRTSHVGDMVENDDGDPMTIDYSGVDMNVGFCFTF